MYRHHLYTWMPRLGSGELMATQTPYGTPNDIVLEFMVEGLGLG